MRRWLRYEIRFRVADLRGKPFPGGRAVGDFQEDAQLQEGVRSVLVKLKKDIRQIAAYNKVLKIEFEADKAKDDDPKKKVGKK